MLIAALAMGLLLSAGGVSAIVKSLDDTTTEAWWRSHRPIAFWLSSAFMIVLGAVFAAFLVYEKILK